MKRKIIGIFVIALLTTIYIPTITSSGSQVQELGEGEINDIKIFFIGRLSSFCMCCPVTSILLSKIGVYKEIDWMDLPVEGNNIFLVDGKTIQLEPPCHLILYNLEGFGTSSSFIWFFIKSLIPPCLTYTFTFMGNCESYQIQNET